MPSTSLAEYLAKNYLTADPTPTPTRPKKKRKKNQPTAETTGLIIADDDPPDLRATAGLSGRDNDEYGPAVVGGGRSAEFRKTKKNNWKTIGSEGATGAQGNDRDRDAADAILADAVAEDAARRAGGDEDPMVIEEEDDNEDGGLRMESGARAGLQTAEQTAVMAAAQRKRKKAEEALYRGKKAGAGAGEGEGQETIYRDASGRIINVAMKRAEARRVEEEKKIKEMEAKEALMGDVQRQEREERRQALEEAKVMPLARTAEDEELNEDLKAQSRWNDPAAQFLTKRSVGASKTGKPLFKGAFQPNRYGIRPGHRWDGVDRGNGFEKEWFTARNRKGRIEALEYEWQMDA
ncbi:Pre-mRNA-splicing factor of RES complex-domain-containing protein [Aspergillus varians]